MLGLPGTPSTSATLPPMLQGPMLRHSRRSNTFGSTLLESVSDFLSSVRARTEAVIRRAASRALKTRRMERARIADLRLLELVMRSKHSGTPFPYAKSQDHNVRMTASLCVCVMTDRLLNGILLFGANGRLSRFVQHRCCAVTIL